MSWSISTRDMARIRSFEDAKKHWESQPAWKNELTCWRPLSKPRETHKRIVRQNDGHSYACFLYDTALVTYFADGSVALRTHDTHSSVLFANCVNPSGCSAFSHRGRMFWQVRTDEGTRFYMEGDQALILVPTEKGNWRLTTQPAELIQWVYDRKKGAEVQKMLRPYADWYKLTTRLGGLSHPATRYRLLAGSGRVILARELATSPESFPTLAQDYGSPEQLRAVFYEATGARYKAPLPHDSLPKEFA
jgi:hypothetical protein